LTRQICLRGRHFWNQLTGSTTRRPSSALLTPPNFILATHSHGRLVIKQNARDAVANAVAAD
jgi:hypothetical protein